jgi:ribosomal protein S18 acetylase RimI-like enzyme
MSKIIRLPPERAGEVVTVLCDAFYDYPVMRYVLETTDDYDRRLTSLVNFFVAARAQRDGILLARVADDGQLGGAATVTPRIQGPVTEELRSLRDATWRFLGKSAEARYDTLGGFWGEVSVDAPQLHLNMIGVRADCHGLGYGGDLLRAVHALGKEDPLAEGISLTTESERNVTLYERFGYEVVGSRSITADFQTWGFFQALKGR